MGDGPRGLLAGRDLLGLLPPRPRAQPRLPLGRGRPAGDHRPRVPPLLRGGALERARSDPQGAALRPDRPRGEPRRRRQGGLLLPRFDADPLVHEGALQVPAGRVPLRASRRGEPAARQGGPRVRAGGYRRARRWPLLRRRRRVREGRPGRHPDPHHRREPRPRGRDAAPPADALVPEHLDLGVPPRGMRGEAAPGAGRGTIRRRPPRLPGLVPLRRGRGGRSRGGRCSSPTTKRTTSASSALRTGPPSSGTPSTSTWSAAAARP